MCKVVNIYHHHYDIYIGRPGKMIPAEQIIDSSKYHFGNPFAHDSLMQRRYKMIILPTRDMAVKAYHDWLLGREWQYVEPDRNEWIRGNLHKLKGKILGCFCKPKSCHGDILVELVNLITV
jgi:hypothetical protein